MRTPFPCPPSLNKWYIRVDAKWLNVCSISILYSWSEVKLTGLCLWLYQVAFEKVGVMSLHTISKQRKKEQPAVIAELERRVQRLNTSDSDQGSSVSHWPVLSYMPSMSVLCFQTPWGDLFADTSLASAPIRIMCYYDTNASLFKRHSFFSGIAYTRMWCWKLTA